MLTFPLFQAWYEKNGKLNKYQGYSNGKSVLQAALKKSVYLMPLPTIGKKLRFRFATPDEIKGISDMYNIKN